MLIHISCKTDIATPEAQKTYPRWVGDIAFDSKIDNETFNLCNDEDKVLQYFNNGAGLEYRGEKSSIVETFKKNFRPKNIALESGLLRIRFIVNCQGETGRFRTLGMDQKYKEKRFNDNIVSQILSITKSLDGWIPKEHEGTPIDYYQHLIFKIHKGEILKILP